MDVDVLGVAARLGASADALAALGALIRTETEGLEVDPRVHAALRAVVAELLGDDADLDMATAGPALGLAQTFFAQGAELLRNPGRSGGWDQVDPGLLQGIGRMSMSVAGAVGVAARQVSGLAASLDGPDPILDVGTGVGWLAVALARAYPQAKVLGIDIFQPALDLAAANVAGSDVAGRVELRRLDVRELAAEPMFGAAWLPLPFLPEQIVPDALAAVHRALVPDGWLLAGTFAPGGPDRLSELLMDLRTVRSGGRPWTADELIPLLADAGYVDVTSIPRTWPAPVHLVVGRRP